MRRKQSAAGEDRSEDPRLTYDSHEMKSTEGQRLFSRFSFRPVYVASASMCLSLTASFLSLFSFITKNIFSLPLSLSHAHAHDTNTRPENGPGVNIWFSCQQSGHSLQGANLTKLPEGDNRPPTSGRGRSNLHHIISWIFLLVALGSLPLEGTS